ncbi:MAG TPA: carboxypeptidase-like regulatory domain-containing protein [Bryobacteraceae bacterium]|nr:carboxypeptidase-like regulatory domain-containing protein [Bryobacteraceae bacterium]
MDVQGRMLMLCAAMLATRLAGAATATLSGTVRGLQGESIARAHVSATHVTTGRVTAGETDRAGHYILSLNPGEYELSGSARGFAARITKVTLADGEKKTLDLTLRRSSSGTNR